MKNIIFYKSNTGFTKKYVDMLENRISPLEMYPINKISKKLILEADNIFYGGPIKNNVIEGLAKFLKKYKYMKNKNIFIFATGIQPSSDDKRELVIMSNSLDSYHVRLYLVPGGLDINGMKFPKKQIMKIGFKLAAKKEGGDSSNLILNRINERVDLVNNMALDVMIDKFHAVNISKN